MDWLKGLNEAMKYIEENLEVAIDLDTAAKRAYCSSFWFQRMFSYLTDLPLSEYIRRRRMTKAALDIRNGEKVIDVALKYGYNSPTAFNRAFRSVHGIAPSEAKREGVSLIACPPARLFDYGQRRRSNELQNRTSSRIQNFRTKNSFYKRSRRVFSKSTFYLEGREEKRNYSPPLRIDGRSARWDIRRLHVCARKGIRLLYRRRKYKALPPWIIGPPRSRIGLGDIRMYGSYTAGDSEYAETDRQRMVADIGISICRMSGSGTIFCGR